MDMINFLTLDCLNIFIYSKNKINLKVKMIIDCISDLHGYFPKLQGGDLLLIAGDLTARDEPSQYVELKKWLKSQDYSKKIVVGGNHDNFIQHLSNPQEFFEDAVYLCDTETEFEGLMIWGAPWTRNFLGQNPVCKAFGFDFETQMLEKFDLIPDYIDILITHSPPEGILDETSRRSRVGSSSLKSKVLKMPKLKLHLFGHIHEGYGIEEVSSGLKFVNASYVNEYYEPNNNPVRIIL